MQNFFFIHLKTSSGSSSATYENNFMMQPHL